MLFLLDTGVCASECVSVHLDDVDWDHGRVRVLHGKGQKPRWVGFGQDAQAALRTYLVDAAQERVLDEQVAESFPASDVPAATTPTAGVVARTDEE